MKLKRKVILFSFLLVGILFWVSLPKQLFLDPYSSVTYSAEGKLLGARIAKDGQWRFPMLDSIPDKYSKAIVAFEDERFYFHPGVDPLSILRAIVQNVKAGEIESGASTLTMQVIRLSRKNIPRKYTEKVKEAILALRLDLTYSKSDILNLHSAHAPYGCNIVGINAACWRYFGKSPNKISWGEACLLAVLPNAPSLMHPGKNRDALKKKRNRLLKKLFEKDIISNHDYILACDEHIPQKPKPLPNHAFHVVEQMKRQKSSHSTIDFATQEMLFDLSKELSQDFSQNGIQNLAAIVANTKTGEVIGYIGNSNLPGTNQYVDMVHAPRSSGSILKPILHAHLINEGLLNPNELLEDAPVSYGGFSPQNFNKNFSGAVPASEALSRSLNIPAVHNLKKYGVEKFLNRLHELNFTTLPYSVDHYGLSLILGGAEVNLWELASTYAFMGRTLLNYQKYNGQYLVSDLKPLSTVKDNQSSKNNTLSFETKNLSAGAIWHTFEALSNLKRPNEEGDWEQFSSSSKVAWKTGTSFGHKDAWAIGVNPIYTIAVWVGNADGEGRKNNVGTKTAGRLLFDILNRLPRSQQWFEKPFDDMIELSYCSQSGQLASEHCSEIKKEYAFTNCERTRSCQYHHSVVLNRTEEFQINSSCADLSESTKKSWFTLSPTMAYYYKKKNPSYQDLPPFAPSCMSDETGDIAFLYPSANEQIFIPKNLEGEKQKLVCKVNHSNPNAELFWHVKRCLLCKHQRIPYY